MYTQYVNHILKIFLPYFSKLIGFCKVGYNSKIGISVKFVQGDDPEEFARLIDDK